MSKPTDTMYRVYPLAEPIREAIRQAREARGQTNQQFIAEAVVTHLPALIERLQELGFGPADGKVRSASCVFQGRPIP